MNHFIRRWPRKSRIERDRDRRRRACISRAVTVSTEEFWLVMRKPGFVRLGAHHGALNANVYHVAVPPEQTSIIDASLQETFDVLGFTHKRTWLERLFNL